MNDFRWDGIIREPKSESGGSMYILLAVLGLIAALAGAVMLTPATLGVGVIALGVFLVALARVIQADRHHALLMKKQ